MSNVITARVSDEVLAMIDRLASSRERSRAWITSRLIEAAARKEIEFADFIQEGIDSLDRGEGISQDEMERWFDEKIAARALQIAAE
jgi:predicted transcriptional regulator